MAYLQETELGYEEVFLSLRISTSIWFLCEPCYTLTSSCQIAFYKLFFTIWALHKLTLPRWYTSNCSYHQYTANPPLRKDIKKHMFSINKERLPAKGKLLLGTCPSLGSTGKSFLNFIQPQKLLLFPPEHPWAADLSQLQYVHDDPTRQTHQTEAGMPH